MHKLSFFHQPSELYELSLQALKRRRFTVTEKDEVAGMIRASIKTGFLKPKVDIELHIERKTQHLTSLTVATQMKKRWFGNRNDAETAEVHLVNTIYNCFNRI